MSHSIDALLAVYEADAAWREPGAFHARADAIDWLDMMLVGMMDTVRAARATALLDAMERIDAGLYEAIRTRIRARDGRAALAPWLPEHVLPGQHYDALDALLTGVLALHAPPVTAAPLPPDMVFYQPTPARHIVDAMTRGCVGPRDHLLDLGAGLGHVAILAHILTGARCTGVEREPGYVEVGTLAARDLALDGVSFVAADARDADYDSADVFYLFTPFTGTVLRDVVERIGEQARSRPVRVLALGPCTRTFARMPWLRSDDAEPASTGRTVVFRSL